MRRISQNTTPTYISPSQSAPELQCAPAVPLAIPTPSPDSPENRVNQEVIRRFISGQAPPSVYPVIDRATVRAALASRSSSSLGMASPVNPSIQRVITKPLPPLKTEKVEGGVFDMDMDIPKGS